MSNGLTEPWQPANPEGLARDFSRLGWIGFWMQLALISIPIVLLIYIVFVSSPESAQRRGIDLSNYLSHGSLLVMLFTTVWFYRYTRLAPRLADPELRPSHASVMRTLWIGIGAGLVGVSFSMVLMMSAVVRLLFVLLATPQTGIAVASPLGGDPTATLSAIDAVSLTALLISLTAELLVLAFGLWLLFRVTRPAAGLADATA